MKVKEVEIAKEVIRSDGLRRFACGDLLTFWPFCRIFSERGREPSSLIPKLISDNYKGADKWYPHPPNMK